MEVELKSNHYMKIVDVYNLLDLAMINHPVHIVINDSQLSPSAFIPFCDFGGNMSAMGVKIDQFDVPVCNSFQAKTLNDQLCYEVDLNNFVNKEGIDRKLRTGFYFLMDFNEDRQVNSLELSKKKQDEYFDLARFLTKKENSQNALIYLNTIGK